MLWLYTSRSKLYIGKFTWKIRISYLFCTISYYLRVKVEFESRAPYKFSKYRGSLCSNHPEQGSILDLLQSLFFGTYRPLLQKQRLTPDYWSYKVDCKRVWAEPWVLFNYLPIFAILPIYPSLGLFLTLFSCFRVISATRASCLTYLRSKTTEQNTLYW